MKNMSIKKTYDKFVTYCKNIPKRNYALALIVLVGLFLRSYNLHDWLYFYPDQMRDVTIVGDFVSGKTLLPLLGFKAASTNFELGAMYYYFQIISGEIFGVTPSTMAYPDVFFGVLSILLLYYFLKRYFSVNVALALTGLYSVSFYAIRYSRFAWNTNPIPFFVILFLLALLEFLYAKNETHWKWIVSIGIALGVGVQLHTVLLILLPITLFGVVIYFFYKKSYPWKKIIIILLIALFLNTGQIISEINRGFKNTKYFFDVLNDRSPGDSGGIFGNLATNVVCHAQANVLYVSSLENNDNCDSLSYLKNGDYLMQGKKVIVATLGSVLFGLILLIAGYWLLIYYFRKERDEKRKLFLGLILGYALMAFLIILPIIGHNGQVRYWLPVIFLPFLFLGLVWKYFVEKFSNKFAWLGVLALGVLVALNFGTIITEVKQHADKVRSNAQYVVLDELQAVNDYIIAQSAPQKEAYIFGGQKYLQNFFNPLSYVAEEKGFNVIRGGRHPEDIPRGESIFFIDQNPDSDKVAKYFSVPSEIGLEALDHKNFGNIAVYRIKNLN